MTAFYVFRAVFLAKRKAAFVQRVNELGGRWWCLGEDAEPAEWIDAFVDRECALRNGRTADAVEAVAAGDEIAAKLVVGAAVSKANHRTR